MTTKESPLWKTLSFFNLFGNRKISSLVEIDGGDTVVLYTTANKIVNLNIQKNNYGNGSGVLRKPIDWSIFSPKHWIYRASVGLFSNIVSAPFCRSVPFVCS